MDLPRRRNEHGCFPIPRSIAKVLESYRGQGNAERSPSVERGVEHIYRVPNPREARILAPAVPSSAGIIEDLRHLKAFFKSVRRRS